MCRRLLRPQAAFRLSPGSPIKALDPVGLRSYCFITSNRPEVTNYLGSREKISLSAWHYTIDYPCFECANHKLQRLSAHGFDAIFEAQVDAFLDDI